MASDGGIPVDRWPGPVCRYDHTGDEAVVRSVDDDFRGTFGDAPAGEPVLDVLRHFGLTRDPRGSAGLASIDRTLVRATGNRGQPTSHIVQNVSPSGDEPGFLLFSEIPDPSITATSDRWIDVDDVASVVSHDLRNPLDVATARLRAGREISDNEHFERVAEAHDRMERIIEDVLTLARGEDVVEPDDRIDLAGIAEDAWEMVRTEDATLTVESELPTVVGDENRLNRLFENLFRNAVEHGRESNHISSDTPCEGKAAVRITIGGFRRGSTVGFFVADDGVGIRPEDRDTVFEPGFSCDDHGTGLGLSIAARVVALHDWSIGITKSEAGGARFEITGVGTA